MNTTFIYGLYSSDDDKIRYVGKANDPKDRLRKHLYECRKNNNENKTHKCCWMRNIHSKGEKIMYTILTECEVNKWPEYECKYMSMYDGLTNTSKGGIGGSPISFNLTYEELLEWKSNNLPKDINTIKKWKKFINKHNFENIPINPNKVYSNRGWTTWGDFLNTKNKHPSYYLKNNISFEEFKIWIKDNNITSRADFVKKTKLEGFPENVPKKPSVTYKDKGWVCWYDILGFGRYTIGVYWDYEKCRNYLKENYGPMTVAVFRLLSKENKLPAEIPKKPERVFDNFSYIEFLSTERGKKYYESFERCKEIAQKIQIKSRNEWVKYVKTYKLKPKLPGSPDSTYKEHWISWDDFLKKNL